MRVNQGFEILEFYRVEVQNLKGPMDNHKSNNLH